MYFGPVGSFAGGFAQGDQAGVDTLQRQQALRIQAENQAYIRQQRAIEQAGQRVLIDVIGPPPMQQTVPPGTPSRPMMQPGAMPPGAPGGIPPAPGVGMPPPGGGMPGPGGLGPAQPVPVTSGGPQGAPPPPPYKALPSAPQAQPQGIPPPPQKPQTPGANLTVEEFVERAKAKGYKGPEIVAALQLWAPLASAQQKQEIAALTAQVKALDAERKVRKDQDDAEFKRMTLQFRVMQLTEAMKQKGLDRESREAYQRELLETRRAIAELGAAGRQAKTEAKAESVEDYRQKLLASAAHIREILSSGKWVTGIGGTVNRMREGVLGSVNMTTDTEAHEFLQEVRMLQNMIRNAPKELGGIGPKGRTLAKEQADRDQIVQGLAAFDNPKNVLAAINRLEEYYGKKRDEAPGEDDIKSAVEAMGEKYEPDKYDYRMTNGKPEKKAKAKAKPKPAAPKKEEPRTDPGAPASSTLGAVRG